jgi:hypothetical protein
MKPLSEFPGDTPRERLAAWAQDRLAETLTPEEITGFQAEAERRADQRITSHGGQAMSENPDLERITHSLEHKTRIRVTGPTGASWTGIVVGILQESALLLEKADGKRVMLPLRFDATIAGQYEDQAASEGELL